MIHAYPRRANLHIARAMCEFIEAEVLPDTGINHELFWLGFGKIVNEFTLRNKKLLEQRDDFQKQINHWHQAHREFNPRNKKHLTDYTSFLENIGYLEPEVDDFQISTSNVDSELATQAGPQMIVSAQNSDELLQAANARWGSLFNALYHSDIIKNNTDESKAKPVDTQRMADVVRYSRQFLDQAIPLRDGSHLQAKNYTLTTSGQLRITLDNGQQTELSNHQQLLGYRGDKQNPEALLLSNRQLKIEICFDTNGAIGKLNEAAINDIVIESALSVIVDCEDTVATPDVEDKLTVYRNWLALVTGKLQTASTDATTIRIHKIQPDKVFTGLDNNTISIPGQPVFLVRNVGLLMSHPAILDEKNCPIQEGILDAVVTATIALKKLRKTPCANSKNIYIVKPKLHGAAEVEFICDLFRAIEKLLNIPENTIKLGLLDEERRTSVNLKNCIYAARERIAMLTNGFNDRIADEISTSMYAGPMVSKSAMVYEDWHQAYEADSIKQALACGLAGKAQIGKGLWAYPEQLADMMKHKIEHPLCGANAAWVPTQRAATLHAMHYHQVDIDQQRTLIGKQRSEQPEQLKIPVLINCQTLAPSIIQAEIDVICQNVLNYVVRWVEQGNGSPLIVDANKLRQLHHRSSLRLNCQLLANWLKHEICNHKQIDNSLKRVAVLIDEQNNNSNNYQSISKNPESSFAFIAARELILKAADLPNGYTETLLREYRLRFKNCQNQNDDLTSDATIETA